MLGQADHTFYWVVVRAVAGIEDSLKPQLLTGLRHSCTFVHGQTVAEESYLRERVLLTQLLEELDELGLVDGLLPRVDVFDAVLFRDGHNAGQRFLVELSLIVLQYLVS